MSLDDVTRDLQARRMAAGNPSYSEIALRIRRSREGRGIPRVAAQVARTTIYELFQPGRTRVNVELVGWVIEALGGDVGEVDRWLARYRDALLQGPEEPIEEGGVRTHSRRSRADLPKTQALIAPDEFRKY